MVNVVSPESCGISSEIIEKFLRHLNENGYAMHSVLMAKGDKVFLDSYWKPFHSEFHHRLNSVSKSFVGIAIGFLIEEGKLSMDDKVYTFFPESLPKELHPNIEKETIYDLMTMCTFIPEEWMHWVRDKECDRQSFFFAQESPRPPQAFFQYDSPGNFILGCIVEKLTGKPFMEYLKDKCLREMGFSEETCCIKGPDDYSWADSGVLCRPCDLLKFARFLMDGGKYNGKQYLNEEFVRKATSRIVDSNTSGYKLYSSCGYGFQIWQHFEGGFALNGMGGQFVWCFPDYDFVIISTADNQGNDGFKFVFADMVMNELVKNLGEPLPENPAALQSLRNYESNMELVCLDGEISAPMAEKIYGKTYTLKENKMGIKWLRINANGDEGTLEYENAQGVKTLPFGLCKNVYTKFPEEGYPDMKMLVFEKGNYFPCASSAAWRDDHTLAIRVQMIGKHLGALYIRIGFTNDGAELGTRFMKNTNCFLHEYHGYAHGIAE